MEYFTPMSTCNICSSQQKSTSAEIWCLECVELLCSECSKHHAFSNSTKNHNTISITEYRLLPDFVLKVEKFCYKHNETLSAFCRNHESLACMTCVLKDHKFCLDISKIEDVVVNAKNSIAFIDNIKYLSDVSKNIEKLETDRRENLALLPKGKKKIETEVATFRANINKRLDEMQKEIISDLYKAEKTERDKIQSILKSLSVLKSTVSQMQMSVEAVKKHASDLQAFVFIGEMEKFSDKASKKILDMKDAGDFNNANLIRQEKSHLSKLTSIEFGEIVTEITPSNVELIAMKEKQAQLRMCKVQLQQKKTSSFKLIRSIETGCSNTRGCCLLPCGRSVFTCNDQGIIRFFDDGNQKCIKYFKCIGARDIAYYDENNSIVISSSDKEKSIFAEINLSDWTISFSCEDGYSDNYGVVVKQDNLIYCARPKVPLTPDFWFYQQQQYSGICQHKMTDRRKMQYREPFRYKTLLFKDELPSLSYVTEFSDRLYFTKHDENSVTCCDMDGRQIWKFTNDFLKCPLGVSVDKNANVYVVYKNSANVVVISPDGQRHKEVLSASDGLVQPQVLYYQQLTNQLLVANKEGKAFVFDVSIEPISPEPISPEPIITKSKIV